MAKCENSVDCVVVKQDSIDPARIEIQFQCGNAHPAPQANAASEETASWGMFNTIMWSLGIGFFILLVIASLPFWLDDDISLKISLGVLVIVPSLINALCLAALRASDINDKDAKFKTGLICGRDISKGLMVVGGILAAFVATANLDELLKLS